MKIGLAIAAVMALLAVGAISVSQARTQKEMESEVDYEMWRNYFDSALNGVASYDPDPAHAIKIADEIADLAVQKVRVKQQQLRPNLKQ